MAGPDRRRWEGDERGAGVADAAALGPRIEDLATAAREAAWVAEEPEAHLWPHLERALARPGSPWTFRHRRVDPDGALVVELDHVPGDADRSPAVLQAHVFGLLGTIAESTTFVELLETGESRGPRETIEVRIVTGTLPDQTAFRPHGHVIRLVIHRPAR